ncbi:MAG: TetR/AcrR family transcriptional regulator [Xanthobacteraceae bacterium]|nr:TetR/AcrR family transcriptional regulator [Xanthobacteraceae bacterium]
MVQVKKPQTRAAILDAAQRLFRRQSYHTTTLAQIAHAAGMSTANLYVYFGSKLDILYAVYEPWMHARLDMLQQKVNRTDLPLDRLRLILRTLWRDIPAEENGFVNNIVQALSTAGPGETYKPALLNWMEERIGGMIRDALPAQRQGVVDKTRLAHLLVMALDGYSIHNHINPRGVADNATIDAMAELLLGTARQPRPRHTKGNGRLARHRLPEKSLKSF